MQVPVILTINAACDDIDMLPAYARQGDAGCDARANIAEPVKIMPRERALIPTGIKVAIPEGYEIQVRPRSGLALKQGLGVCNAPGTLDSGFRNEIGVILINHGNSTVTINPGDRVAQLVLNKFETIQWMLTDTLPESERGTGGFGSTGKD